MTYGFNGSITAANSDPGNLASPEYIKMAGKAKYHRYPGGTISNFFDWNTETMRY